MPHVSECRVPFDSDALRANIAGTARAVVIPERYQPLVQAVRDLHGVCTPLAETLAEYFHTYRNLDHLIAGLEVILLRNWPYFERSPERARCFGLLSELLLDLLEGPLKEAQASLLLRQLLTWCTTALGGPHAEEYLDHLQNVGEVLSRSFARQPAAFLERDTLVRDLVEPAVRHPQLEPAFSQLHRSLLDFGYRRLLEHVPMAQWAVSEEAELNQGAAVAAHMADLDPGRLAALLGGVAEASGAGLLSPGFPLFSSLVTRAIDGAQRIDNLADRFAVLIYLLKDDALGHLQDEAMRCLLGAVGQLVKPENRADIAGTLGRLTRFFRGREGQFLLTRFRCYEAIGVTIGRAGHAAAADQLTDDLLSWPFQYPDVQGATDDWETIVNPFHLPAIRCWMRIIESNPAMFERLAVALAVQLRLGGVHIADTDLFQRDVTRFLNADVRPIYFVAKQLLRMFPVYFNEVGAEGELRAVSTEIDEVCRRQDTLTHFLRKQAHAESSNRLVAFSRAVLNYWITFDPSGLEPFLSAGTLAAVRQERGWAEKPHEILLGLWGLLGDRLSPPEFLDRLVALPPGQLEDLVRDLPGADSDGPCSPRRVTLMVRTHQLLAQKYSFSVDDLAASVGRHLRLDSATRQEFGLALGGWLQRPDRQARDRLLDAGLAVLEQLKAIILGPSPAVATENLYLKRHIAAGIPSVYGSYSEPRFDALSLTFRVEGLVARLLEEVASEVAFTYATRATSHRMQADLTRFERALSVDGVDSRSLATNLRLLESGLGSSNFTFSQYLNVFQFIAGAVTELSRTTVLPHDEVLRAVLDRDPRSCVARGLSPDATAEVVLREVLVSALGLQTLDRFASAALRQVSTLVGRLGPRPLTRMMRFDPDRLVSPLHQLRPGLDDELTLGFKGLGLKQLVEYGHRVPEGFILSTELFSAQPGLSHRPFYEDIVARIRRAMGRLEEETGLGLGDPDRLLTLSIRSGAAVSMPGAMATFVDVGLNQDLVEALALRPGFAWAAWDSYRRFLQLWAMASGVERDFFDAIMNEFKARHGVEHKLDFLPEHMREVALTYRARARERGVRFVDDPFRQVLACIRWVLRSWNSPEAELYRRYLGVAEEWGTAVVVQRMVFGNLSRQSGSGVTFTRHPLDHHGRQVRLFGDFTTRSQGEDLVGGLVFPLPISEAQRLGSPAHRGMEQSLERDFPEIHRALLEVACDLVHRRQHDHQELEFTFESASANDLYILQKRTMVPEQESATPSFDTAAPGFGSPVAVGTGVSGGAFSGRVAVLAAHIDRLQAEAPQDGIVLLRPDTVPEDLALIARVAGLLTARGGATSHAAVTARRLGKTAVVDCRRLEVVEGQGAAWVAGTRVEVGDWISIDGRTGNIFLGRIPLSRQPIVAR